MIVQKRRLLETALVVFFLVLFALVSTRYKLQYAEAVRPFYTYGLVLAAVTMLVCLLWSSLPRNLLATVLINLPPLLFFILLVYFTLSTILISSEVVGRQVKDHLYFIYWITIFPLIPIFLVSKTTDFSRVIYLLSISVVIFAMASAVIGYLIIFDLISIKIGTIEITQSQYLAFRIHGAMGESTALAALLGVAFLSLSHVTRVSGKSFKIIKSFLLISIIATGSRNAIVSLSVIFFVHMLDGKIRVNKLVNAVFGFFGVIAILVAIVFMLDLFQLIYILLFDRPTFDTDHEQSRIFIWRSTIEMLTNSSFFEILFGHGAFELRRDLRAGFNTPLEILYDYGLFMCMNFLLMIFSSGYIAFKKYKKSNIYIYRYAFDLLIFGFTFSMFMSYFPTAMFNFAVFGLMVGIWISLIPVRYLKRTVSKNSDNKCLTMGAV